MGKRYPPEFKADVVAMALQGDVPKQQVARDFGITETTLYRWIRQHEIDAGRRNGASSEELSELRQLRKNNKRLEQENLILRRAAAYFAKDALPK